MKSLLFELVDTCGFYFVWRGLTKQHKL